MSRQLAREKVNLALLARRENILRQLADELKDSGSVILPVKCDVSNEDETTRAYREIQARFGLVDIAIFNSGSSHRWDAVDFRVDIAREIFDVNVFGMPNFFGELLPGFIKRKEGTIVGVSSLADCRGLPKNRSYSASKAAATALLESLRVELREHGIKGIKKEKTMIQFPLPVVLGSKLLKAMPGFLYDRIAARIKR